MAPPATLGAAAPGGTTPLGAGPLGAALPAPALLGFTREEDAMPVGDYFDRFAWEPRRIDPDAMSAEEFLDAL